MRDLIITSVADKSEFYHYWRLLDEDPRKWPLLLYVMQDETGLIKVGVSQDPFQRRKNFGYSCIILKVWDLGSDEEKWWHEKLTPYRAFHSRYPNSREWYSLPAEVLEDLLLFEPQAVFYGPGTSLRIFGESVVRVG
jgi:hypothetical protein